MHVGHENFMFSKSSNKTILLGFNLFSTIMSVSYYYVYMSIMSVSYVCIILFNFLVYFSSDRGTVDRTRTVTTTIA